MKYRKSQSTLDESDEFEIWVKRMPREEKEKEDISGHAYMRYWTRKKDFPLP